VKRAVLAAVLALAAFAGAWATHRAEPAPAELEPVRVPLAAAEPAEMPAERPLPRVLQPDAERAGQIAGQLAEARYRLARAGASCDDAVLDDASLRFADARTAADDADWDELGAVLDDVLAALDRCPADLGRVRDQLRIWRRFPPFR
jgi:hypothetical protein